jgi:NTE family protein
VTRIGLALGSGGARGWSHIGAIRALEELGIKPEIVCGASMGAVVGAAWCAGALDKLEAFARDLNQLSVARLVDIDFGSGGLFEGKEIMSALGEIGVSGNIEDLQIPFLAVATDLYSGHEIWLRKGDVNVAVRASLGLPGVFSPVQHEERWLMDGGMSNPIPVSCCRALGADLIIAVNPNSRLRLLGHRETEHGPGFGEETLMNMAPDAVKPLVQNYFRNRKKPEINPPSYVDVLVKSIDVMTNQIRRARLAGDPPDIMVNVDLGSMNMLEFARADEAIEKGKEAMKAELADFSAIFPGSG